MSGIKANMGYLKSIPGILKIVECVLLLLAFSCVSDAVSHGAGRVSFFLAVTVIGWLVVIGLFVFFFLNLTEIQAAQLEPRGPVDATLEQQLSQTALFRCASLRGGP
ncbi:hypothetical protein QZH41_010413, partial [Actinostola sp. cb2023]